MVSMDACSCLNTEPHVIARCATADGKPILQWDDGTITWAFGYKIRKAPRGGSDFARRVGGLVIGDASLYEASEIPDLIEAARFVAKRSGLPGDMRKRYREITRPTAINPSWEVLSDNRDGRPTIRVWILPRLLWPGLAVWHERGVYEVVREVERGTGTYESTGFSFRSLKELIQSLDGLRSISVN